MPEDLPVDKPLIGLIEALLRPAPRDRPSTASAARNLLMNPAPRMATQAVARRPAPATAVTAPRKSAMGESGEPRFVHLGNPPRDPKGEFSDVYRNLMHPLFPARRAWSDVEHFFWVGFAGLASVATLGVVPAVYSWIVHRRRKTYEDLFRRGTFTTGTILSIPASDVAMSTTIKYEFEVDGVTYRGYMRQPREMARYWIASDTVAVLYDPGDPSQSCIVYR